MISVDVAWRMQHIPNYAQVCEEPWTAEELAEQLARYTYDQRLPVSPETSAASHEALSRLLAKLPPILQEAAEMHFAGFTYVEMALRWKARGLCAGRPEFARQKVCKVLRVIEKLYVEVDAE